MSLLPTSSFPSIISQLTECGPAAYKVVGNLRSAVDGKTEVKCFTDGWPIFTTVVTEAVKPIFAADSHSLYTKDLNKCEDFLANTNLADWARDCIMFGGITSTLVFALSNVAKSKGVRYRSNADKNIIMEAKPDSFIPERLVPPDGLQFSALRPEQTHQVASTWKYTREDSIEFIEFTIRNCTTVCLNTEDGRTVGWMMEQLFGASGMLYVLEDYRGKGLGKLLVKKLRDELLFNGKPSYVYVNADNEVSINLHKSCGFVNADKSNTYEWFITEKY